MYGISADDTSSKPGLVMCKQAEGYLTAARCFLILFDCSLAGELHQCDEHNTKPKFPHLQVGRRLSDSRRLCSHLVHEHCTEALWPHDKTNVCVIVKKQCLSIPLAMPPRVQVQQQTDKQRPSCNQTIWGKALFDALQRDSRLMNACVTKP